MLSNEELAIELVNRLSYKFALHLRLVETTTTTRARHAQLFLDAFSRNSP
jgi:hypothetical protein